MNKVLLNKNQQVELVFGEKINEVELKEMLDVVEKYISINNKKSKLSLLLIDVNKLTKISIEARQLAAQWIVNQPIKKVAVYGDNLFMKHFTKMFTEALVLENKVSFFDTKEDAVNWL